MKIVFQNLIVIAFVIFLTTLTMIAVKNQFNVKSINPNHFNNWLEEYSPIIIDLRESVEILTDSLIYEPVIHLPFLYIENNIDKINIPIDQTVLFVCSDGNRARLICSLLKKKSENIYYLEHGLDNISDRKETIKEK